MGLFQRLFSPEYRRAVAAEADGDYATAAKNFALCGESAKVAEMHLAQARGTEDLSARIDLLRRAAHYAKDPETTLMIRRLLARSLERRAGSRAEPSDDQREAAQLYCRTGDYQTAGQIFEMIDDVESAIEAYTHGGLIEQVEQLLGKKESSEKRRYTEQQTFSAYQTALREGDRAGALEALSQCIEAAENKGEYRRLHAELNNRVLRQGRVTLVLEAERRIVVIGQLPLVIGRENDCDLVLRSHSLSRRHARIYRQDRGGYQIEDLLSRNGTHIDQHPIAGRIDLSLPAHVRLGTDCRLLIDQADPPTVRIEVLGGADQGLVAYATQKPLPLGALGLEGNAMLHFQQGFVQLAGDSAMRLNGRPCGRQISLAHGDQITIAGRSFSVE